MIHYTALHIPEPCTKIHYDDLPYHPEKRPCHLCQKPVYDFRDRDEAFLNEVWEKHQGDFCGSFRYDQLDTQVPPVLPWSIFQCMKTLWAGFYLSLLTLWSMLSKGQNQTEAKGDSNTIGVYAKECRTCESQFSVTVSVNGTSYGTYTVRSNDTIEVKLPPSIRPTDRITLSGVKRKRYRGWTVTVSKRKEVSFEFGSRSVVELKMAKRKRLRLIYRRSFVGCPKFR